MNPETFAEWYRRQGRHIICTQSSYWCEVGPRVYQAFPFNQIIMPSDKELRSLFLKHGTLAVRYSTPLDYPEGMISYHTVLNGPYDIENLSSKSRTAIRKGLGNFQIEPISFERLAGEGWELQRDTLERQGRLNSMSQTEWEDLCKAAVDLPGFEAWAATKDGELAATEVAARINDKYVLVYEQSKKKYLSMHVNNALVYSICKELISRPGITELFLGLHSLDAPPTVDAFKFQLGVIPRPVRQRVVFNPIVAPFVNKTSYGVINGLAKRFPHSNTISKANGMFRFFLEGKRAIKDQEWPDCLKENKDKVLAEKEDDRPMNEPTSAEMISIND